MNQFQGILSFEFYRINQRRKILLLLSLILFTPLLMLLISYFRELSPAERVEIYLDMLRGLYLQFVLPLACLLQGASLIQEELEEGNLIFLVATSTPRWVIFLGKLVINFVFLLFFLWLGLLLSSLVFFLPKNWTLGDQWSALWSFGKVIFLGTGVYLSIFALLSLILKRVLLGGIGYIVGVEYIFYLFSNLSVHKLNVLYYLQSFLKPQGLLLLDKFPSLQQSFATQWNQVDSDRALIILAIVMVLTLGSSVIRFQVMELGALKGPIE